MIFIIIIFNACRINAVIIIAGNAQQHPQPPHLASSPLSDHLHAWPQQAANWQVQGGGAPANHLMIKIKLPTARPKLLPC